MPTLNVCVQIYMIKKNTHKIIKSTNISLLFRSISLIEKQTDTNRCLTDTLNRCLTDI